MSTENDSESDQIKELSIKIPPRLIRRIEAFAEETDKPTGSNWLDKDRKKGCKDSGIGVRLFHDFRRNAARNFI